LKQFSGTTPGNKHRGTTPELSFPKSKRLVTNRQFKAVLARNLRVSNGLLTLFVAENDCDYPRLGISVGSSFGSAVVRNRLKRLLREAFRQNQGQIPAGFDYLVMPRPSLRDGVEFEQVKASLLTLVNAAVGKLDKK